MHNSLDTVLNVGLIVSIIDTIHPLEELNRLLPYFSQFRLTRNRIVQTSTQITDLVRHLLVRFKVWDFSRESKSSSFLLFCRFRVRCLNATSGTLYKTEVILSISVTASESAWYNFLGLSFILALTAKWLTILRINSTLSFYSLISSDISLWGSYFCASQ